MSLWDWMFASCIVSGVNSEKNSERESDPWHDDTSLDDVGGIWSDDDDIWDDGVEDDTF